MLADTSESPGVLVAEQLKRRQESLAIAESCTGGLISSRLTDLPGSSAYTFFNVVTYSNESKVKQLGVSPVSLEKYGAVSQSVAKEMAKGIAQVAETDWGLSVTGIAGPDGSTDKKPVGLLYIGIYSAKTGEAFACRYQARSDLERTEMKQAFAQEALSRFSKVLSY